MGPLSTAVVVPLRSSARGLAKLITVTAFAREHGIHPQTARDWLHALDKRSGGRVLFRMGHGARGKLFTTISRIRKADPDWLEERKQLCDDVDELKKIVRDQRIEIRSMKMRVRELLAKLSDIVRDHEKAKECKGFDSTLMSAGEAMLPR